MPIPMSKEEITLTINRLNDENDENDRQGGCGYDRVIDHICNYIDANLDDFMECYEDCEDDPNRGYIFYNDDELHDTDSLSDIIGGGQG